MSEITINYKDAAIATMDASGTKTLQTQGKYCEDDIEVVYARPSAPSGTKQISITQNGTTVEDVAAYANAEITVNVQGGGGTTLADLCNGVITRLDDDSVTEFLISLRGTTWNLQTIFLKNLEVISVGYCFANNKVQTIVLPSLNYGTATGYFFSGATDLTKIDLGASYSTEPIGIRGGTFNGASALNTLILRKSDTIVPLQNINVFGNTPFASGKTGGTLFVPYSLISSYQSATNWSTILGYANNSIAAIEGSQYENYYADGTPIA